MALAAHPSTPRRRLGASLALHAIASVLLALALSVLLTLSGMVGPVTARGLRINFVYALCIGVAIQALQIGGLHALTAWQQRHQTGPDDQSRLWPGWRWFVPWLLLSMPVGYALGGSVADALTGNAHVAQLLGGSGRTLGFFAMVTFVVSILMGVGFVYYGRARTALARAEALERQAAEHRLRLLESQLEPHMLFNTLANLQALIALDPPQAQAMLERLIGFLRGTLGGSLQRTHTLADEFARLSDYLALMAVRMGPRLAVRIDLPRELETAEVPALLLQPLVENAIVHGLEPSVRGGTVHLAAQARDERLELTVLDDGVGLQAKPSPGDPPPATGGTDTPAPAGLGFGSRQIRERLWTLHGARARIDIEPGPGGGTRARIVLPLRHVQPSP